MSSIIFANNDNKNSKNTNSYMSIGSCIGVTLTKPFIITFCFVIPFDCFSFLNNDSSNVQMCFYGIF